MHLVPRSLLLALTTREPDPGPAMSAPVDEEYWLSHCEGFSVEGPEGRLGVVDHLVYRSRADRPDVVAVTSGLWRARTAEVLVSDVVEVRPAQARLVVRPGLRPFG
jgi:hypothetical protein